MTVIKRDGQIEELEPKKILNSISKANENVKADERLTVKQLKRITDTVVSFCETQEEPIHIDLLEDIIEKKLMEAQGYEVAKQYITYRYEKERVRNTKFLTEKLTASNVQNQNANVDEYSFGGRVGETASFVTKQYALDHLISRKAVHNHNNNEIYIHDLDAYAVGSHNCLSIPFDKLLATGFNTRQGDVRPAGSINTAFQLVAVIFQLQSLQQFGGVSSTHLDWTMVPYVRKSFKKHYADGLKFVCHLSDKEISDFMVKIKIGTVDYMDVSKNDWTSIDDDLWDEFSGAKSYATDMTIRELDQAVEGLMHNLNTLQSRSGNQLPFTSINYGTCTLPEGRMVTKALLEGSIKGIGKFHKTSIFPCGIFQCKEGINRKPGDPNYDLFKLACKSTSLRLYPNYVNCDFSGQKAWVKYDRDAKQKILDELSDSDRETLVQKLDENPEMKYFFSFDVVDGKVVVVQDENPLEMASTMGCRTANAADCNAIESIRKNIRNLIDGKPLYDDVGSAARKDFRGNICPTTIIMPTLAMQVKEKLDKSIKKGADVENYRETLVEDFMKILDKKIHEAKDSLMDRYDWITSQPAASAKFMYENGTMGGYVKEEGIKSALRHGTLAIGQLGLAETLHILIGCNHATEKGMKLAKRIEQLFSDRCKEFKKEYSLNFGVYYSPSENLCFTSMKKFQKKYGVIEHVSDKEYFTNSMHIPVWEEMTPFEKIDLESQLTPYHTAGCITYVELDASAKNNMQAIEELVNYAMDKDIPYAAINIPNDTCCDCGYCDEIIDRCPVCGSKNIQSLKRVTGYLSTDYRNFNPGKQNEVEHRVKHNAVEV